MAKFEKGDQVVVNGSVVAEIVNYDDTADRLVYVHNVGGGTNTVYGHISNTRLQRLVQEVAGEDVEDEPDDGEYLPGGPAYAGEPEGVLPPGITEADEITTAEAQSE